MFMGAPTEDFWGANPAFNMSQYMFRAVIYIIILTFRAGCVFPLASPGCKG